MQDGVRGVDDLLIRSTLIRASALVALAVAAFLPSMGAFERRYTFEDETAFLAAALHRLPDGCTVTAIPLRDIGLAGDLDCCLRPARAPVTLLFPRLHFAELPAEGAVELPPGCTAYFEGASCSLSPTRERERWEPAVRYFRRRCADARAGATWTALAAADVSPFGSKGLFERPPRVRLLLRTISP